MAYFSNYCKNVYFFIKKFICSCAIIINCKLNHCKNKNIALPTETSLISSSKVVCKKSKNCNPGSPEWNNATHEEKKLEEKSYHFAHPTQDFTNSHPHIYHRKRMGTWEKDKRSHIRSKKNRKELKSKIKLNKLS